MESDDGGSGHVIHVQEEATQPQQQLQEGSAITSVSGNRSQMHTLTAYHVAVCHSSNILTHNRVL